MPSPLLAAGDIDTILGFVFVVVWVIAWLFKLATGQAKKGPPVPSRPRPPARPRDGSLQDEIDIFIQEVGPKKAARRPPAAETRQPPAPKPPGPALKPASKSAQKASRQPTNAPAPAARAPSRRLRPGEEISSRHMPDAEQSLGSGVKQHLSQHMAERVSRDAAAFVQPKVEQSVTEHLGPSTTSGTAPLTAAMPITATPTSAVRMGSGYAELFKNPTSLRQAMVINLILSPPPGRKPRQPQ